MNPFKKAKNTFVEVQESDKVNNIDEVVDTLEKVLSIFPSNKLVIVGSSVLTLCKLPRRAHDIDVVLDPCLLEGELWRVKTELYLGAQAVSIQREPYRPMYSVEASEELPIQLISGIDRMYEPKFRDLLSCAHQLDNGLQVASLSLVADRKRRDLRLSPYKKATDRYDISLIEKQTIC